MNLYVSILKVSFASFWIPGVSFDGETAHLLNTRHNLKNKSTAQYLVGFVFRKANTGKVFLFINKQQRMNRDIPGVKKI